MFYSFLSQPMIDVDGLTKVYARLREDGTTIRPRHAHTDVVLYRPRMRYRVVLEYDADTGHYTATVPGLPGVICDAKSKREVLRLAREGIAFYLEELSTPRKAGRESPPKPLRAKVVSVDV